MPIDYRRTCFHFIRAVWFTPEHIRAEGRGPLSVRKAPIYLLSLLQSPPNFRFLRCGTLDERNTTCDGYASISKLCNLPFFSLVDWQMLPPAPIHSSRLDFVCHLSQEPSSSFREIPIPTRKIPVCRAVSTTFARQSRSILPSWALEPAKLGLSLSASRTSDFDFSIFPTSAVGFLLGHVFSLSSQFNRYGCRPRRSSHERSLASDQLSLFCLQEHQATWTRPVP